MAARTVNNLPSVAPDDGGLRNRSNSLNQLQKPLPITWLQRVATDLIRERRIYRGNPTVAQFDCKKDNVRPSENLADEEHFVGVDRVRWHLPATSVITTSPTSFFEIITAFNALLSSNWLPNSSRHHLSIEV
jgi:hypothetical protein